MQSIRHLMHLSRPMARQSLRHIVEIQYRSMCTNDSIGKPRISFIESPPALDKVKSRHELQIDWENEMKLIEEDEERENSRSVLAPVDDESKIYAEPVLRPSFNLAAYVQKSETLQQLMKLGVNLDRLDNTDVGQFIANLNFKQDIESYILLLTNDIGVSAENIGRILTKNPNILKESLDDIQVRINYLQLKRFTQDQIAMIVVRNPFWLNHSTREIDERLGFFQKDFNLNGDEVRLLVNAYPKVITYNLKQIKDLSFSVREECCFEPDQVREILLKCPKLWMMRKFWKFNEILNSQNIISFFILFSQHFRSFRFHAAL